MSAWKSSTKIVYKHIIHPVMWISTFVCLHTRWFRSLCRCLRGHITRTTMTTGMAPVPNSTSGHVDMHGISKKSILIIYCWLATDLRKTYFRGFLPTQKWKSGLFGLFKMFCTVRRQNCPLFFLSFSLSLSPLSLPWHGTPQLNVEKCVLFRARYVLKHLTFITELWHEVYRKSHSMFVSWLVKVYNVWHLIFVGWLLHISTFCLLIAITLWRREKKVSEQKYDLSHIPYAHRSAANQQYIVQINFFKIPRISMWLDVEFGTSAIPVVLGVLVIWPLKRRQRLLNHLVHCNALSRVLF
jgi:hypothetical protein